MRLSFAILSTAGLLLVICACQSQPKNFVESATLIRHVPSGIEYPKKISGWEPIDSLRREKISPEILAELKYYAVGLDREVRPSVSVFFMNGSTTANLKLIENKEVSAFKKAQKIGSDIDVRLPSKRKIFTVSYLHSALISTDAVGVSVRKDIRLRSSFVQTLKNPQLVFLVTTQENRQADEKKALQMMDDFMLKK